jgi:hypothetical protein
MSGDPEQEYFADGMVEEIITALSRIRWLFVIARNSSFTYKGQAVDVKQVGRELGVRYVLEGSVRKGGSRVRITAQLIEAETGAHLWPDADKAGWGNGVHRHISFDPRNRGGRRRSPHRMVPGLQPSEEPDPANLARRFGDKTSVLDWRDRLVCSRCDSRAVEWCSPAQSRAMRRVKSAILPTTAIFPLPRVLGLRCGGRLPLQVRDAIGSGAGARPDMIPAASGPARRRTGMPELELSRYRRRSTAAR